MSDASSAEPDRFRNFSDEYAQAVEALDAIERQADVLMAGGAQEQLQSFLERFSAMAADAGRRARLLQEEHFGEWFEELAARARKLEEHWFRGISSGC